MNTSVQHVFNTVEVEKHIDQVPLLQFTDKVVDNPVVAQRQISIVLVVQKSIEIAQLQYCDEVINVPVVQVVRVPQSQVVAETAQQITDKVTDVPVVLVVPVPQVRMVRKTVEDPQFQIVEKTVENSETQTIQGLDMPVSQVQVMAKTVEMPFNGKIVVIPGIETVQGPQTSQSLNGEFDAGHDEKSEQDAFGSAAAQQQAQQPTTLHQTSNARETGRKRERGKRERKKG